MDENLIEVSSVYDSKAEVEAFKILEKKINMTDYQINKHVNLKEIFKGNKKEPWMDYHVDFLIEDLKGHPVMGIEINGIKHWNEPQLKERDKTKKFLFAKMEIPLVCIPLPELPSYSKEEYKTKYSKALQKLMEIYLLPFYHRTSFPVYCKRCGKQMAYRFRNNHAASFYSCLNAECTFQTISSDKVPVIFNEAENIKRILQLN